MEITEKTIEGLIAQTKKQAAACQKISSDPNFEPRDRDIYAGKAEAYDTKTFILQEVLRPTITKQK